MSKFEVTSDGKRIDSMILSVHGCSKALHETVPVCAASCVLLAVKHHDVTKASQLLEALGNGVRKKPLRSWFFKNGPFEWDTEKEAFRLDGKRIKWFEAKLANSQEAFIQDLKAEPIWPAKEKAKEKEFDLSRELKRVLTNAEKAVRNGKVVSGLDTLKAWSTQTEGFSKWRANIRTLNPADNDDAQVKEPAQRVGRAA